MSKFKPESYAEALETAQNRPVRPRKALRSRVRIGSKSVLKRALRANKGISAKGKTGKKKSEKPKLMSRKRAIRVLDDLVSKIVRLRDGSCVQCGTTEKLTCGHVLSRRSHATRWDLQNCFAQCWSHNFAHGSHSPYPYFLWFIKRFGQQAFDELYTKWAKGQKFSTPELRATVQEYQAKLESLQT